MSPWLLGLTTLDPGAAVVRLPIGMSAVGLTERVELQVTPFDLTRGGTRLGAGLDLGPVTLSPSIAQKWSLGRTSGRLEATVGQTHGAHAWTLTVGADVRLLRQVTLADQADATWHIERVHAPVTVGWGWTGPSWDALASIQVAVWDEGKLATFATGRAMAVRRWDHLFVGFGVGGLVGRPSEHLFLGAYEHRLGIAYPLLDLGYQG